ncbi:PREDICTED: uncharacterized protein LOC101290947 [Fragaria vesca subsp. vesca]
MFFLSVCSHGDFSRAVLFLHLFKVSIQKLLELAEAAAEIRRPNIRVKDNKDLFLMIQVFRKKIPDALSLPGKFYNLSLNTSGKYISQSYTLATLIISHSAELGHVGQEYFQSIADSKFLDPLSRATMSMSDMTQYLVLLLMS